MVAVEAGAVSSHGARPLKMLISPRRKGSTTLPGSIQHHVIIFTYIYDGDMMMMMMMLLAVLPLLPLLHRDSSILSATTATTTGNPCFWLTPTSSGMIIMNSAHLYTLTSRRLGFFNSGWMAALLCTYPMGYYSNALTRHSYNKSTQAGVGGYKGSGCAAIVLCASKRFFVFFAGWLDITSICVCFCVSFLCWRC